MRRRWPSRYVPAVRRPERIPAEIIIATIAALYDVPLENMRGPRRLRPIAWPRQIAMTMCREFTPLSFPAIGTRFGGRDHSTVISATRNVANRCAHFADDAAELERVRALLLDAEPMLPIGRENLGLCDLARMFPSFSHQARAAAIGAATWRATLPAAAAAWACEPAP